MRRHNKLSVRPNLTQRTYREAEKGFYTLELINNVIGPALIEEFLIKVDGKLISEQGTGEAIEKGLKIIFLNLKDTSYHGYPLKRLFHGSKRKVNYRSNSVS